MAEIVALQRYQVAGREFTSLEEAEEYLSENALALFVDDYSRTLAPRGKRVPGGDGRRETPSATAVEAYQTRAKRAILGFLRHLQAAGGSVVVPGK